MNLINVIKLYFRRFLVPYYHSEIKEAFLTFNEIKENLEKGFDTYGIWPLVSRNVEKRIILNPKGFISTITKKNLTPREAVYNMCYNNTNDELDCTDTHELYKRKGLQLALKFLSAEIDKVNN